jgi:hypothetical protein
MRAVWGLVLAGCTSTVGAPPGPPTGVAACGDPQPFDDAVFAALTATAWDQNCGTGPFPPTCNHVSLAADGTYSWTAVSDYVERDQSGAWNFAARTDTAGIVCLDTGAVLPYTLGSGSLAFGRLALYTGAAQTQTGARGDLRGILSTPVYAQMSGATWLKTNDFDLATTAQQFTLARDGTYEASYRDGNCTHGGLWGIDMDPRSDGPTPIVIDLPDVNDCDLRGGTSAQLPSVDEPRIDTQGRLILSRAQYGTKTDPRPWFEFDGYTGSVATSGYLDRDLSASSPTAFDLDFENRSTTAKTLTSFAVRVTPVMLITNGYSATGPTVQLAQSDLGAAALDSGSHAPLTLSVAPAFTGDALLEIELDYADSTQPYQSRGEFIVTIAP